MPRSAAARKLEPVPPEMLVQFAAPRLELPETTLRHPLVVGTGPAGIFAAHVGSLVPESYAATETFAFKLFRRLPYYAV